MTTPPDANTRASGFDAHHPPSKQIIENCVHCGFCLPVCPTYVLWNEEMDSPRGRIYLMKLASEGHASMNPQWVGHFDSCLGCMACMTACPSGVDYGKLIRAPSAKNSTVVFSSRFSRARSASASFAGRCSPTKNPACNR
jgi:glycolate oxidase iron-sulfur subunit